MSRFENGERLIATAWTPEWTDYGCLRAIWDLLGLLHIVDKTCWIAGHRQRRTGRFVGYTPRVAPRATTTLICTADAGRRRLPTKHQSHGILNGYECFFFYFFYFDPPVAFSHLKNRRVNELNTRPNESHRSH